MSVYIATKDDDDEVDDETERAADIDHPLGLPVSQASIDSSNVRIYSKVPCLVIF